MGNRKQSGGIDIQDWQSVDLRKNAEKNQLELDDIKYYVSVVAVDSAGNQSDIISSDGVKIDTKSPLAPKQTIASAGDMSISIKWSSNSDTDLYKYIIYRSEVSGFNPVNTDSLGEVDFRESIYIDSEVEWGKDYYYRVAALDSTGYIGEYSDEVSETLSILQIQWLLSINLSRKPLLKLVRRQILNGLVRIIAITFI